MNLFQKAVQNGFDVFVVIDVLSPLSHERVFFNQKKIVVGIIGMEQRIGEVKNGQNVPRGEVRFSHIS